VDPTKGRRGDPDIDGGDHDKLLAEILLNQGYNNYGGAWFYTGFIILAPVYSYW
jgi:hypothetical protein